MIKKRLSISILLGFLIFGVRAQCNCEKIQRSDGIITTCQTLPVCGDANLQIGLSLASNGKDLFITTTIRYIKGASLKINGDLSLRLTDNNLMTFKLLNSQSNIIGNNEVEQGVFLITKDQFSKIKNSKILTLSIILTDKRIHTFEATINKDILVNQSKCIL